MGAAVTKLVTMFNPVGAIIQGIITIYNTIMFFIERAQQIARLVNSILDSIESIAKGATKTASDFVEKTLANTLPVIIAFLARWLGLGSVTEYIRDIIGKIRAAIAGALEKLGLWIADHVQGPACSVASNSRRPLRVNKRRPTNRRRSTATSQCLVKGITYQPRLWDGRYKLKCRRRGWNGFG